MLKRGGVTTKVQKRRNKEKDLTQEIRRRY